MLVYQVLYWMNKKGMFNLFKSFWDYKLVLYLLLSLYFSYWVFFLNILGIVEFASPFLAFIWPYFLYSLYTKSIVTLTLVLLPIFLLPTTVNIDNYSETEFINSMSKAVTFDDFLHRNIFYIALDVFVIFGMSLHFFVLVFGEVPIDPLSGALSLIFSGFLWVLIDSNYISNVESFLAVLLTGTILLSYYKAFYVKYSSITHHYII